MKRILLVLGMVLVMALGLASPAQAAENDVYRSTPSWTLVEQAPEGPTCCFSVHMHLVYEDNGNTVTLKRIYWHMPQPRVRNNGAGYYFDEAFVRCNRNDGSTDWFFNTSNKVAVGDDDITYTANPTNINCGEDNVRYGGYGIINRPSDFDLNDEFGPQYSNPIPVD